MYLNIKFSRDFQSSEWDKKVNSFNGSLFHTYSMVLYSSKISGGAPLFVEVFDASGSCIAIAAGVLIVPRIWPSSKFLGLAIFESTPVTLDDDMYAQSVMDGIEKKLKNLGVFKVSFASYDSVNSDTFLSKNDYEIISRHEYEIDLSPDYGEIYESISSTKRKHYRKSEKNGVVTTEFKNLDSILIVEKFRDIVLERRGLVSSKNNERRLSASKELFLSGRFRVFVSCIGDKQVGACVFATYNNKVYALRSGSCPLGNENHSPMNLYLRAINVFKDEGFSVLNLGGAKENENGIRQFKKMLGAKESYQPAGCKIISKFGAYLSMLRPI